MKAGDVVTLGAREVVIVGVSFGALVTNWRGAVAVRNLATNRLSYIPKWKLEKATARAAEDGQ